MEEKTDSLLVPLPTSWRNRSGTGLVSAYRMVGRRTDELDPAHAVDLDDVCVVFANLGLPRIRVEPEHTDSKEGGIHINVEGGSGEFRDPEATSLFVTAIDSDAAGNPDLQRAENRINNAVSLVSTCLSFTLVHHHVEDYRISFDSWELTGVPVLLFDPLWYTKVDLDEPSLDRFKRIAPLIGNHSESGQVSLSMRWFDEAKRSSGVDAFLKIWIALETLIMKKHDDLHSINKGLALIYGMTPAEVGELFRIRRISGLRDRVVHAGLKTTISGELVRYIGGVYHDLMAHKLEAEPPYDARAQIEEYGDVLSLLPGEVRPPCPSPEKGANATDGIVGETADTGVTEER